VLPAPSLYRIAQNTYFFSFVLLLSDFNMLDCAVFATC